LNFSPIDVSEYRLRHRESNKNVTMISPHLDQSAISLQPFLAFSFTLKYSSAGKAS
jgi:hypothetical protein